MANNIKINGVIDENLRPIAVGEEVSSLEVTKLGNGCRVNGDLEVSGSLIVGNDSLLGANAQTGRLTCANGAIIFDAATAYFRAGSINCEVRMSGYTGAGFGMTFYSILDAGDYFRIDTGTNGVTTITTVDDDAEGADLILNIDGYVDINSASGERITLDCGGDIYLDAAGVMYLYYRQI